MKRSLPSKSTSSITMSTTAVDQITEASEMTATSNTDTNVDRFVATMTFAQPKSSQLCDCDECGPESLAFFQKAIASHKRQKLLQNDFSNLVLQERSLLKRHDGLSIWKLVLPPSCTEPMTEYGNSHRIVYVEELPMGRVVKSIGNGIIGSKVEEESRRVEEWERQHGYLYRSNGGKAVGWVNDKLHSDKDLNVSDITNDIVLYIVKVTQDLLERYKNGELIFVDENDCEKSSMLRFNPNAFPNWVGSILEMFQKSLGALVDETEKVNKEATSSSSSSDAKKSLLRNDISKHAATRIRLTIDPFIKQAEEKRLVG